MRAPRSRPPRRRARDPRRVPPRTRAPPPALQRARERAADRIGVADVADDAVAEERRLAAIGLVDELIDDDQSPGCIPSRSEPTADTEITFSTPSCLSACTFAR